MNLTDYMQGSRKGKEAHRIEREAMRDAFLSEALEGFEEVTGDHAEAIRRMQQKIVDRSQPKGRSVMFWLSMAASIALVIGFGWYLYFRFEVSDLKLYDTHLSETMSADSLKRNETIAMTEPVAKPDVQDVAVQEKALQRKTISLPQPTQLAEDDLELVYDVVMIEDKMMKKEVAIEPIIPKIEDFSQKPQTELPVPAATETLQDRLAGVQIRETSALRDTRRVQGRVVDETGEPLPGVSITVKNTEKGTVTDVNGEFALNTDDKTILQANFVGFEMKEIEADTSKMLIAMHESTAQLEEVVVVGYGTQKRTDVTGAATAIQKQIRKIVPEPVIGQRAYQKYLRENIVRPVDGDCARVKGKVQVRFNVDNNGRPYNFQLTGKLCDDADREAIRLITQGCDWTRGNTEVTVTVEFR